MNVRLFGNNAGKYMVIDRTQFFNAAQSGNDSAIDTMLAMRANGATLDLNMQNARGETALEIMLQNKDFNNARKLLRAGAQTVVQYKVWVHDDNDCYPYGGYETRNRDLFERFAQQRDVLAFLIRETEPTHSITARAPR